MVYFIFSSYKPTEKLTSGIGHKFFYFVKSLYRNINLKIKINFKYGQKMFSGSLSAQYLIKTDGPLTAQQKDRLAAR